MKKTKLVLDSNLWVSYFFGKHVRNYLDQILADTRFDLLISQRGMDELELVLNRPKFEKYITKEQIKTLISLIRRRSNFIDVSSKIVLSRDPKDDYLLSLSLDGHANYLITGDEDLLILKKFGQTTILKIADFIAIIGNIE
jgi:uncharacterized protein